ncbi:hypothetical protein LCGC14_0371530 [marine sediment metagenome]|uniref:Uncharacterized protein n=1 Tax=marine sediment metagenome TaxID=412755 RepID=A0A0F9VS72_9ZZZZ
MSDIIDSYEHRCDACMHRIGWFCKAYQVNIDLIEEDNCKRRKKK